MNDKITLFIVFVIFLLFAGIFIGYLMDNDGNFNEEDVKFLGNISKSRTELTVSSEGPINLNRLIYEIKTHTYFEGYDKDTLTWMESLTQNEVFISDDGYVIMNREDAGRLNTEYVTDAYIEEYIECTIVENRSLGGDNPKDVLLVKDVKYLGNQTFYLVGA